MRKQFDPGLLLAMTQSGCVAAMKQKFMRWLSGKMYHEDRTKDFGFIDAYKDWKGFSGGSPEACAAMDKDPFFVSKMLDSVLEGFNSKMSFYYKLQRLLAPFTYDPANIKCKAYIYHGELDGEVKLSQAELNHKLIPESELIVKKGHGHYTIALALEMIALAIVEGKSTQLEGF